MVYIGNKNILNSLQEQILAESCPNSILFYGHKGIGKATAAKELILSVVKHFAGQEIQNLLYITSKNSKSGQILIEDLKQISHFIGQTCFNNCPKFVLIDSVDDLNINAQNALLKSLEEPNSNCYFVLISHQKSKLPATITSRCVSFMFKPPEPQKVKEIINLQQLSIPVDDLEKYAIIANYIPGLAINLTKIEALKSYFSIVDHLYENAFTENYANEITSSKEFEHHWKEYFFLLQRLISVIGFPSYIYKRLPKEEMLSAKTANQKFVAEIWAVNNYIEELKNKTQKLYLDKKQTFRLSFNKVQDLWRKIST